VTHYGRALFILLNLSELSKMNGQDCENLRADLVIIVECLRIRPHSETMPNGHIARLGLKNALLVTYRFIRLLMD
jgi:hypothetical protein